MADLKEFQVGSTVYNLKDETARNSISALQAAVGSPLVANTASNMTDTTKIYVYTGSETGYTTGHWYYYNGSAWTDGGVYNSQGIGYGSVTGRNISNDVKQALLACFEKVAWVDADGHDYYDELESVLYGDAVLLSITAVYTQSGTVYENDSLDDLKSDLVVTAHYDDNTSRTINAYTLSGTLTEGTSTITVAYGGKTATFTVNVTEAQIDYTKAGTYTFDNTSKWLNKGVSSFTNTNTTMEQLFDVTSATKIVYYELIPVSANGIIIRWNSNTYKIVPTIFTSEEKYKYTNAYSKYFETSPFNSYNSSQISSNGIAYVVFYVSRKDNGNISAEDVDDLNLTLEVL